jgi:hypothetical protein
MTIPEDDILKLHTMATYVGGRKVYAAPEANGAFKTNKERFRESGHPACGRFDVRLALNGSSKVHHVDKR